MPCGDKFHYACLQQYIYSRFRFFDTDITNTTAKCTNCSQKVITQIRAYRGIYHVSRVLNLELDEEIEGTMKEILD